MCNPCWDGKFESFFAGLFAKYGLHAVISVMLAFLIQLPWLVITDYYFVHLPAGFIISLVIALTVSNLIWALIAHRIATPLKNSLE